ncbi:MAG TPA: DUF2007 domain-containing protein [Candidatus Limnocylindria bacterium]
MAEIGVAFTNDEPSAEVIASRLRAVGIAARVDRGLRASWQVGSVNQITVLVDEKDAKRAESVVGAPRRGPATSVAGLWAAIALVVVALVIGIAAVAQLLTR